MAQDQNRTQGNVQDQNRKATEGQSNQKDASFQQQAAGSKDVGGREAKRGLDTDQSQGQRQSEDFNTSDRSERSDADMDRSKKTDREANY